jgi:Xaa-Pro aminopeptidase
MRYAAPGVWEYQVQAAMEYVFGVRGSRRLGYPSIVGSGPNACVLHYTENNRRLEAGDLVLIDAGAEYDYYSADITRTFPVDGKFTAPQRTVYELVLAAQEAALALARPGSTLVDQHEEVRRVLASGLSDLGLVPGSGDDAYQMGYDREFFMHGTGHWLGLDVHDAGRYRLERRPRPLEPGMAFTVEPGLYFDPNRPTVTFTQIEFDEEAERRLAYAEGPAEARKRRDDAKEAAPKIEHEIPAEFLGIGVRIEDDVVITEAGHENLTSAVPKAVAEVEDLCAEVSDLPRE